MKVGHTSEFHYRHSLRKLKNNNLLKKLLKWVNKKQKIKKSGNKEKHPEISLYYTCVPKISMIYHLIVDHY